jgi:N-acetylmuramoyl-L-alanine amidase
MRTMKNLLVKKAVVTVLAVGVSLAAVNAFWGGSDSALSQLGSSGSEVRAIQERLKERGLFNDSVTGYYGEKTKAAVIKFQKQQGISQTGTVRRLCVRWAFLSALCRRLRSRTSIFWRG